MLVLVLGCATTATVNRYEVSELASAGGDATTFYALVKASTYEQVVLTDDLGDPVSTGAARLTYVDATLLRCVVAAEAVTCEPVLTQAQAANATRGQVAYPRSGANSTAAGGAGQAPSSTVTLVRVLYSDAGKEGSSPTEADVAAVWARIRAGAEPGALREAAKKGGPLTPAEAPIDDVLTAGGAPQ
jgi:hypothetical protein